MPRRRTRSSRRPTARTRRRRRLLVGLATVTALALGGGYAAGQQGLLDDLLAQAPELPGHADGEAAESGGTASPGADVPPGSAATGDDVDADRARDQLAELPVAEWEPMSGYSRDRFSHWRSVDGCDARQTVLARDGRDIETEDDSCRVVSGTWHSPFDGTTLTDPGDVDIDHIVPLAAAWRAGANAWDDERRADFANDLDTPQLIAVSASTNRAKGDQDPSQWQPPERGYWCQYAHDWVTVKHHWDLSVTASERDTLADMLDSCP